MKNFDRYVQEHITEEDLQMPDFVHNRVEETLDSLPLRLPKRKPGFAHHAATLAACMALVFIALLPNLSVAYAEAVDDIPVIGNLVRVFTIRNYFYEDGHRELQVKVPSVVDPDHKEAEDLLNQDVTALTNNVINQFYHKLELSEGDGYGSVTVDYETISNAPHWFTLKLTVNELAASSYVYERYYHIDRTNGRYVTFSDLFTREKYAALEAIILDQMKERMEEDEKKVYWIDDVTQKDNFAALHDDQNFYFKENENLVIVYDQYEVAPGYMGSSEFEITPEQYKPYLSGYELKLN